MAVSKVLFSSKSDEWATPSEVFEALDHEFDFELDVCATAENHKCEKYFTPEQNGLSQKWGDEMLLQPTIQPNRGVGKESIPREPRTGDGGRFTHPGEDRHEILPGIHISPCGGALH